MNDQQVVKVIGTTTNDNAAAGEVGEVISNSRGSGSALGLTTGVYAEVVTLSLTAGDWDVYTVLGFLPTGSTVITNERGGLSLTTAVAFDEDKGANWSWPAGSILATANYLHIPVARYSLAASDIIYLNARGSFSADTLSAFGYLWGRRAR